MKKILKYKILVCKFYQSLNLYTNLLKFSLKQIERERNKLTKKTNVFKLENQSL